jgi:hypothetical protein
VAEESEPSETFRDDVQRHRRSIIP